MARPVDVLSTEIKIVRLVVLDVMAIKSKFGVEEVILMELVVGIYVLANWMK